MISIEGASGVRWVLDNTEPAAVPRRGTPFIGWEEARPEHRVWVQRVLHGELFDDDRAHLIRAHEVGQIPEVAASPYVARVLDLAEAWDTYLIQELADESLGDALKRGGVGDDDYAALGHNLGEALTTLHSLELIHGDMQPSNVLKVDGVWKLADLGACTTFGQPMMYLPRESRFIPPELEFGAPADPEFDRFGLEVVLQDARGESS